MMKYGPVDVVVLALGEPRFDGKIFNELKRQASTGTIRVLDAMILLRDDANRTWRLDLEDLPEEEAASVGFIETGTRGIFDSDDASMLFEGMVPGSAVVALAIEHRWAIELVNAISANGVEVALNFRVPAVIVDEVYSSL
jgi:hypothetical protein